MLQALLTAHLENHNRITHSVYILRDMLPTCTASSSPNCAISFLVIFEPPCLNIVGTLRWESD